MTEADGTGIYAQAMAIESRADFVVFARQLAHVLESAGEAPPYADEGLYNHRSSYVIEAMAAWLEAAQPPRDAASWAQFATALLMGFHYE